jgi:hypothetical protein
MLAIRMTIPMALLGMAVASTAPAMAQPPRQDCGPAPAGWYQPVPRTIQALPGMLAPKPAPKAATQPAPTGLAAPLTPAIHLCATPAADPKAPRAVRGPTRTG